MKHPRYVKAGLFYFPTFKEETDRVIEYKTMDVFYNTQKVMIVGFILSVFIIILTLLVIRVSQ